MDGSRDFSYDEAVDEIAKRYGVPKSVYQKMLGQESGDNDAAVSNVGAFTAWQIMPATARGLGYTEDELKREPLKAAEGGLRILRDNYKQFRKHAQNEKHAWMMSTAGYHGNPKNVLRDLRRGGYGLPDISDGAITTKQHVLKIFDGLKGETLDRSPFGNVQNNFSTSQTAPDRQPKTFVNPENLPKFGLTELPAEMFLPPNPAPPANDVPITLPKPPENLLTARTDEPDKLPLSNLPKPEDVIKSLPPQPIPAPENRQQLPEDYQNFLKYAELTDSPEARNQYSQTVVKPLAETEQKQNAQFQNEVENYNSQTNAERANPSITQTPNDIGVRQVFETPNVRYEKPTDENIKKGLADSYSYEITAPKNRSIAAREAIKSAYASLPENVRNANEAYRQITGNSLWDDENADYLAWADNEIKTKGGLRVDRNLDYEIKAVVDSFARGGYEGLKNDIATGNLSGNALGEAKKAQTQRDVDLYTSEKSLGKDEFGNEIKPRDYNARYESQMNEKIFRDNDANYDLYRRLQKQMTDEAANDPFSDGKAPTKEEIINRMRLMKSVEEDAKTLERIPVFGTLAARAMGGVGRVNRSVAGVARIISAPFESIIGNAPYKLLKDIGDTSVMLGQMTNPDGSMLYEVAGLPFDLARLVLLSRLPTGVAVGFAVDSGLQSAGRGDTVAQVLKETTKGAALGSLFNIAGGAAKAIETAALRPIARIGVVTGGTYPIARAFGADHEQALNEAIVNGVFEFGQTYGSSVLGKVFKVWNKGKAETVKVENDGAIVRYEFKENTPADIELVLDPQSGVYVQKSEVGKAENNYQSPEAVRPAERTNLDANENALAVRENTLPENNFVTERKVTLDAQKAAMESRNGSASAVLYTDAQTVPKFDETKNFTLETKDGVLLVNDDSLKSYFKENDLGYYAREKAKYLIENDKINPNDLIGGKAFETSDTSPLNNPVALATTDKVGNELSASVVNSPESAQKQTIFDRQRFGGDATSAIVPSSEIVRSRAENRPIDRSNSVAVNEASGAFRASSNIESQPQQQSLRLPESPNKTTTRELDAKRLTALDKTRADSIVNEYENVSGKSPAELYDKAVIKFKDGNLFVNAEATELLRQADFVAFKDAESFAYFGRYLNPSNAARVEKALQMNFGAGRPQKISTRYKKKQFLAEFEKARRAAALGDVRQIVTSKSAPYGLKAARQEENAHSQDYAVGFEHKIASEIFKTDPIGRRAMRVVKNSGYENFSNEAIGREVGAKIWTDTATTDLKLSADRVKHLRDLYYKTLKSKKVSAEKIRDAFRPVSRSARNYLQEKQSNYEQSGTTGNDTGTAEGTRRGNEGSFRDDGTSNAGRTGKLSEGTRGIRGKQSRLNELDLYERKFIEGKTKGDSDLAEKVAAEVLYSKNPTAIQKMSAGDVALDLVNMPKALKATIDLSAGGRQGLIVSVPHPLIASRAFWRQLRSAGSGAYYKKFVEALENHPVAGMAKSSGLYISAFADNTKLSQREEQFMSRLLGDEPVFSDKRAEGFRQGLTMYIRGSERAYAAYLDDVRINVFQELAKQVYDYNRRNNITDNAEIRKQIEGIAQYVNYATGRGSLGRFEDSANLLNVGIFSARNWASRFQVMNPFFYKALPPGARSAVIKDFGKYLGAMVTAYTLWKLAGGDIELDPDNPDFLKIRIGQSHYEISGGMVQQIRYVAQMVKLAAKGDFQKMAERSGDYVRSKLAPVPSAIVSTATGTKISNEPTSAKKEAFGLVAPISLEQLTDGAKNDGWLGAIKAAPDIFGISTARYQNSMEIGYQLAELERKLAAAKKGSDEEKELFGQIKLWRKYYEQAKLQPGELPRDLSMTPESEKEREEREKRRENVTYTKIDDDEDDAGEPEQPVRRAELSEKIDFYKANKDKLFSFAKDELESIILQHAENLRLRGKLSKTDEAAIKEIIPEWSPLRENDGVNRRPDKLKKLPKMTEDFPKLPKRPKLPPIPAPNFAPFTTASPINTGYDGFDVFKTQYNPEYLKRRKSENVIDLQRGSPVADVINNVWGGESADIRQAFNQIDLKNRTQAERDEIDFAIDDSINEINYLLKNDPKVRIAPDIIPTLKKYKRKIAALDRRKSR